MSDRDQDFELGRQLVRETRMSTDDVWADDDCATNQLRWGADEFTDDAVWHALLGALDEVTEDSERWMLGDGFIPESVLVRPALDARFSALLTENAGAREVAQVMSRSEWNWEGTASTDWWAARLRIASIADDAKMPSRDGGACER